MDKLDEIFQRQAELQRDAYGQDPSDLPDEEKPHFAQWNAFALTDELHEAMAEVGWKPWATSRHINREAYKGELVDALHFFVNMCLVVGITPQELFEGYLAKREKNAQRQAEGYDGLAKCAYCRRALDDESTKCRPAAEGAVTTFAYCDELGANFDPANGGLQPEPGKGHLKLAPAPPDKEPEIPKGEKILRECLALGEPFFVIRGKDFFAIQTLVSYLELYDKTAPANVEFEQGVVDILNSVKAWQAANPHLVRFPD